MLGVCNVSQDCEFIEPHSSLLDQALLRMRIASSIQGAVEDGQKRNLRVGLVEMWRRAADPVCWASWRPRTFPDRIPRLLHRRRRTGRHDARLPARPRRRRRGGAGEARRLPARFPRRHRPPVDAGARCTSSACSTPSCAAAQKPRRCSAQVGDDARPAGGLHAPADALQFIAMMPQWDFLDFLADEARKLPDVPAADAGQGHGLLIERRARRRGAGTNARRAARGPRRPHRRGRRPAFDRARRPG